MYVSTRNETVLSSKPDGFGLDFLLLFKSSVAIDASLVLTIAEIISECFAMIAVLS